MALRPAVMFAWRRLSSNVTPTTVEFTDYGLAIDGLFTWLGAAR